MTCREWPDAFVERWLPIMRQWMQSQTGNGAPLRPVDDERDELAWLYGRLRRDDLPDVPFWG